MTDTTTLPRLALIGAGKMGGAMFAGWCKAGLAPSILIDPGLFNPVFHDPGTPESLARACDQVFAQATDTPAGWIPDAVVIAVKPQMAQIVLPDLTHLIGPDTVVLSIMAGRPIAAISAALNNAAVVRAMPNTPAAIGKGITVACAGPNVSDAQKSLCLRLLQSVGEAVFLEDEGLINPVSALSGSGPAYVFLLAELMEQAGIELGIPASLARTLARHTVAGSGALIEATSKDAAELRREVTSPRGSTEAALAVLMAHHAWPQLMIDAMRAATKRASEL